MKQIVLVCMLLQAAWACPLEDRAVDGDPVDLFTGLFEHTNTDVKLNDVFPIELKRTYRTDDTRSRAFGVGTSHLYEIFLVGDNRWFTWIDLILSDGARVHYVRTSAGTSWENAEYTHTTTPSRFYQSTLRWNRQWGGWDLALADGTLYRFPASYHAVRGSQAAVVAMRDPLGNSLELVRDRDGDLVRITSPGGRRLDLTYDQDHRITRAVDDLGRVVQYQYDEAARLVRVTEPDNRITRYTYDNLHRMLTVEYNGRLFIANHYDQAGRAIRQVRSDGTDFTFTYSTDAKGKVTQTDVKDPAGKRRRVLFNPSGYILSDTRNLGALDEETTIYEREAGTNRVLRQRKVSRGRPVASMPTAPGVLLYNVAR